MVTIKFITQILLIIGGINWGLVGVFGFDLVAALLGEMSLLSRIIYTLVGISAIYQLLTISSYSAETKQKVSEKYV